MSQKVNNHLGKIGIIIMVVGMVILFYDAYRINQIFPTNYRFYEHPEIYVPIAGMIITFIGTFVFIFNFKKGKKVI